VLTLIQICLYCLPDIRLSNALYLILSLSVLNDVGIWETQALELRPCLLFDHG
jgi:hypothetical protein